MSNTGTSIAVALSQPISKAAYDYWNAARNGRPLPSRREIDPAQLRTVLPHIMVLQRVFPSDVIFRLAGTAICQAFGRELRDHSVLSLWDGRHRGLIASALSSSLERGSPLLLQFRAHALGQPPLNGEWLMLPLLDDRGHASNILASFAFSRGGLMPKAFIRLELLCVDAIRPDSDRVELSLAASPLPRRALTLVAGTQDAQMPLPPNMSHPWAGLLRDFFRCEEG